MAATQQTLSDFQTLLASVAPLSALVGTRIHSGQQPQGAALPSLTWNVVAAPTDYTHDGDGLDEVLVQFDIDGRTPTQCRGVADAIKDGIAGRSVTVGGTDFEFIFHDGVEITSVADSLAEGTTQNHRLTIDYRLAPRPAFAQI